MRDKPASSRGKGKHPGRLDEGHAQFKQWPEWQNTARGAKTTSSSRFQTEKQKVSSVQI